MVYQKKYRKPIANISDLLSIKYDKNRNKNEIRLKAVK